MMKENKNSEPHKKFYSQFQLDLGRNVVQSMEIDPCLSDVGVEEVRQRHLVDPNEK